MSKTTKNMASANDATATVDSMQQVRELLFGDYQRRVDARLEEMNDGLEALRRHGDQATSALEAQLGQRLDALARQTESDLGSLAGELRNELQELKKLMEQRLDDLQTLMQTEHRRMEKETQEQLDRLAADKAGRAQIATLMRQLADSLDEPQA
ncbi:MAG TPA: hypothetical protein ENJ94_07025 [Gammaproteobacteria bacterium]|nr:hypothetical protein [Gammaproteobacteria bacterium]